MQDKELFSQLLGLKEPWEVTKIKVDFNQLKVDIWVAWPPKEHAPCPECGKLCKIYDHRDERQWRHLDTMQFQTGLHCKIPRVECSQHGIKSIDVPWAEERSRFTALFERFAIDVLLACQNQTKATELLRLSWDEVHEIQKRAVERGLSWRKEVELPYIGIDEKSFLRGHEYVTVVFDIQNSMVVDLARDRKEESVTEILNGISEEQKEAIKAAVIDMWGPYMNAVKTILPNADIVHDKFHIVKHLVEAVDRVRKTEHKSLLKTGIEYLKRTKYLWLTNPSNWTEKQRELFRELKKQEAQSRESMDTEGDVLRIMGIPI